jgi:Mg2+/Co2+ transporter CorB
METYFLMAGLVVILLTLSAFFSGSEIGIFSINKSKIHKMKMDGDKRAITLSKLREDKEKLIGALMLLNTFVNTAASVIASGMCIDFFGEGSYALLISTALMTILILIYGEIMPKTYAVRNAETLSLFVAPFFLFITKLLSPITRYIQLIVNFTLRLFTSSVKREDTMSGLEVLRGALELHHEEGTVVSEDKYMIGGVIDLEKVTVHEVMVHRSDMASVNINDNMTNIINQLTTSIYSRMPIWENEPDNIIGVIHVKDLLKVLIKKKGKLEKTDILDVMRKPWFIPDITQLKKQLNAFRENKSHFALVVDEYGELLGLVTLEDILEEVVGHIEDEHDIANNDSVNIKPDGSVVVDGDVTIRELNRQMHWNIACEEASTVGGLVFHIAQRIPKIGEVVKFNNYRLKTTKKSHNTITKVRISPIKKKVTSNPKKK